jgi:hypothetical protein
MYFPSPDPQGKLQVISVSGSLVTLSLVGTSQNYLFNAATLTFQQACPGLRVTLPG